MDICDLYRGTYQKGGPMKRPSKKQMKAIASSPGNMKDSRVDLGKKVDLPKEDPKQLEYRTLQISCSLSLTHLHR